MVDEVLGVKMGALGSNGLPIDSMTAEGEFDIDKMLLLIALLELVLFSCFIWPSVLLMLLLFRMGDVVIVIGADDDDRSWGYSDEEDIFCIWSCICLKII